MAIAITTMQTPAQVAAHELVDKANAFIEKLNVILTQGAPAEGERAAVSSSDLKSALGTALPKLQAIVAAGE